MTPLERMARAAAKLFWEREIQPLDEYDKDWDGFWAVHREDYMDEQRAAVEALLDDLGDDT